MTSNDFKKLIEQCVGPITMAAVILEENYDLLRPFLKKETGVKLPVIKKWNLTYIELWRFVNSSLSQSTPLNAKGNKGQKGSVAVVPKKKGDSIIPVSMEIAKRIKEISKKIEADNEELESCLDKIENADSPIHIGSFMGIAKRKDIESSMVELYSDLTSWMVKCGDAIRASNGNISNVLELIRLLTIAEIDLYNLVDNQTIQSNELRVLIKEWCHKHGIHDRDVDKLLESSFQRAYTLRDRINNLRNEFYKKIESNNEVIENLISKITDYQGKIEQATNSALNSLASYAEEREHDIDVHYDEKEKGLQNLFIRLSSKANEEIKRIDEIKNTLDSKELELKERFNKYFAEIAKKEEAIKLQSQELKDYFLSVAKEISDKGAAIEEKARLTYEELERENKKALDELQKSHQGFRSDVEANLNKKSEDIDKEIRTMKESQKSYMNDTDKTLKEKLQGFSNLHKHFIMDEAEIIGKIERQVKFYKFVAIVAGVLSIVSFLYSYVA